ncbi:MAG: T9SS type A sorting domain-containing protein [Bacteroidota bacterium]
MKKLLTILFILIGLTGTLSSQTTWYVDITSGLGANSGLSPINSPPGNGPKSTISEVIATGALNDGDIINIAAGTYSDSPTISKNITVNGYKITGLSDIIFNVSTASMVFNMSGVTTFSLDAVSAYGLLAADRFYFTGSDNTGIYLHSGEILLSTAIFYMAPPFLFQPSIPASTAPPPMTWYVDVVIGLDAYNGLSPTPGPPGQGPVTSISHVIITGLGDDDMINIAAGNYTDAPTITKNIRINGYRSSSFTEVLFNLSSADMVFNMTGRTVFSVGAVDIYSAADRFHFTGSTTNGVHLKTGCVHLSNAIFYFTPPFLFQGEIAPTRISESESLPEEFDLMQCYPNPFNPSTTIRYELPQASSVTLKVYNVLGQVVDVLVSEKKAAGVYQVNFNATNLPSGVYFYRLKSGNYTETKKLVLLR